MLRRRRMTRRFRDRPLDPDTLEHLLELARRVPSAGFAQGVDLLVATSATARARLWTAISHPEWRESASAQPLLSAPVLVLPVADPDTYAARYGESDKAASGLAGVAPADWPTPYWLVDASFCVLALLLAAEDAGLGALFFRLHRPQPEVLTALEIPSGRELIGAVCLGEADERAPASGSPRRRDWRDLDRVVHREQW